MKLNQILKVMELIDEKFEALTPEEFKTGHNFEILNSSIDEVLWSDDKKKEFWNSIYGVTYYDETPSEANQTFQILEKYFYEKYTNYFETIVALIRLGELKRIIGSIVCKVYTYNTTLGDGLQVYCGWIDDISKSRDHEFIHSLRFDYDDRNGFRYAIIDIGETKFTEETF